jgi:serine/threonine protein kinase
MNPDHPPTEQSESPTEAFPGAPYDEPAVLRARALLDELLSQIGPYRILERLGQGGMGEVYRAEQRTPIRRELALKLIKLGMDTKQVIARFEAERQALALMDHPHIAKVFDAGADETGRPYFAMELVRGIPITHYADEHKLSLSERLELFTQVCQAIQHAHQKGVIHRDLKPSNILVSTHDGRPHAKVIDFGIAKAIASRLTEKTLFTEFHNFIGTPQYMSPEQATGSLDVDTRSDVYSLGVLLYELLTGQPPFDGRTLGSAAFAEVVRILKEVDPPKPSTRLATLHAHQPNQAAAADPSHDAARSSQLANLAKARSTDSAQLIRQVRGELDWMVMRALDKDRARRYETPTAFADDVRRYLDGSPIEAAPPSAWYRTQKFIRKHRGPVITAAAVGTLLLVATIGIGFLAVERDQEVKAKQVALEQATTARIEADAARSESESQRRLTEQKNDELEHQVYRSGLLSAQQSLHDGRAGAILDSCPPRLRGWEWKSMKAFVDSSLGVVEFPQDCEPMAQSPDGDFVLLTTSRDGDGALTVLDAFDGSTIAQIELPPYKRLLAADVSSRANRIAILVATRTALRDPEATLHVWDKSAGKVVWSQLSSPKSTGDLFSWDSLSLSADGSRVAICGLASTRPKQLEEVRSGTKWGRPVLSDEYSFESSNSCMVMDVLGTGKRIVLDAWALCHLSPNGKYIASELPWTQIIEVDSNTKVSTEFLEHWDFIRFGESEDTVLLSQHKHNDATLFNMKNRKIIKPIDSSNYEDCSMHYLASRDLIIELSGAGVEIGGVRLRGPGPYNSVFVDKASSSIYAYTDRTISRFPLPPDAFFARLRHSPSECVANSLDGQYCLGVNHDNLLAWQVAATGEILDSRIAPKGVAVARFSPDCKRVAIGSRGSIFVWPLSAQDGKNYLFKVPEFQIALSPHDLRFTPNGLKIVALFPTGIDDATDLVVTLDVATGREISRCRVRSDHPHKIVDVSDSTILVIENKRLVSCRLDSGELAQEFKPLPCSEATLSWDRKRIALIDKGKVQIRTYPDFELLTQWTIPLLTTANINWLPNDSRIVVYGDWPYSYSTICDPQRGEILLEVPIDPSTDGKYFPEWVDDFYVKQFCGPWSEIPLSERWGELCKIDAACQPAIQQAMLPASTSRLSHGSLNEALKAIYREPSTSPTAKFVIATQIAALYERAEREFEQLRDDYLIPEAMSEATDGIHDVAVRQLVLKQTGEYKPDPDDLCEEVWSNCCNPDMSKEDLVTAARAIEWVLHEFPARNDAKRCQAFVLYRQGAHAKAYEAMKPLVQSATPDDNLEHKDWAAYALMQARLDLTQDAQRSLQNAEAQGHHSSSRNVRRLCREAVALIEASESTAAKGKSFEKAQVESNVSTTE